MGRRATTRRIGIADVALKAGVSHATVSRVMNGNFTVDPAIAARVRAAATELNYQPNPVGRSLALGKTDTIGIVVPDLSNPTFQAILRGLSMAAAQDGYRVLIADSSEVSSEEAILAGEARRRCDGLVLCAPRMSDAELEELAPSLHPMVLINRTTDGPTAPSLDGGLRPGHPGTRGTPGGPGPHPARIPGRPRSGAPRTACASWGWKSSRPPTRRSTSRCSTAAPTSRSGTSQWTRSWPAGPPASWPSTTSWPWAC